MADRAWVRQVLVVALGFCLAALVCAVVYRIRAVFVPFAAGFVVAYVFDPVLDRLEARGWGRSRSVWTVMSLLLVVTVLGLVLLVPRVATDVSDVWANQHVYALRAGGAYESTKEAAAQRLGQFMPGVDVSQVLDRQLAAAGEWAGAHKADIARWFGDRLKQAGGLVVLILIGMLSAFHFMMVIDPLRSGVQALMAPEDSREVDAVVVKVNRMLAAYVRGLASVSFIMGAGTAIGLAIIGAFFQTHYAWAIGLLAGLLYAVPYLGQFTTVVVALFFGYVTAGHDPVIASALSVATVVTVNAVADNLILPKIVGKSVGLHPLAVLFAMLAGFELFGLVGLIIAVPLAASLRIIAQRWIPILPEDQEQEPRGLPRFDLTAFGKQARESLLKFFGTVGHAAPSAKPTDKPTEDQPGDT